MFLIVELWLSGQIGELACFDMLPEDMEAQAEARIMEPPPIV